MKRSLLALLVLGLVAVMAISIVGFTQEDVYGDLALRIEGSISSDFCIAGAGFGGYGDFPIVLAGMINVASSFDPTVIHGGVGAGVSFLLPLDYSTRITVGAGPAYMGYGWRDTMYFAGVTAENFSASVFFSGIVKENQTLLLNASCSFIDWLGIAVRVEDCSDYYKDVANVGVKLCFTVQPCEDATPVFINIGVMHVNLVRYTCPWETHKEITGQLDVGIPLFSSPVILLISGFIGKEYTNPGRSISFGGEVAVEFNAP